MGTYKNTGASIRVVQVRRGAGRPKAILINPGKTEELPDDQVQDLVRTGKLERVDGGSGPSERSGGGSSRKAG